MLGDYRGAALACRGIFIDWEWMHCNRLEVVWILPWQCWWFWRAAGKSGCVVAGDKWALAVQPGLLLPVELGGEQAPVQPCCSPVPVAAPAGCRGQGAAPAADGPQLPLWTGHVGAADGKVRNQPLARKQGKRGVGCVPEPPLSGSRSCHRVLKHTCSTQQEQAQLGVMLLGVSALGCDVMWPLWGVFILYSPCWGFYPPLQHLHRAAGSYFGKDSDRAGKRTCEIQTLSITPPVQVYSPAFVSCCFSAGWSQMPREDWDVCDPWVGPGVGSCAGCPCLCWGCWAECWDFAHPEQSSLPYSGTQCSIHSQRGTFHIMWKCFGICGSHKHHFLCRWYTDKKGKLLLARGTSEDFWWREVCPTMLLSKTFSNTSALRLR